MNDETLVKNEFYIELAALKGLNPKKLGQGRNIMTKSQLDLAENY